jgi:hypothetical protein
MGFRATGGGAFLDDELVVEVERRRSEGGWVWGGVDLVEGASPGDPCESLLVNSETGVVDGLKGGGSFRVPLVLVRDGVKDGFFGGATRGTVTQSGSSVGL